MNSFVNPIESCRAVVVSEDDKLLPLGGRFHPMAPETLSPYGFFISNADKSSR